VVRHLEGLDLPLKDIYLSTIKVIPTASQVKCFPIYLSFPGTVKELENTFAFLTKKITPTPHLKVFPLPRREEGHKNLWLIPSLSYQPRSGEQEREKETTRGCKENHESWVATNDIRF